MHNKCNVLESSPKLPPTPRSLEKLSSMKLVPGAKKFGDHSFMSPSKGSLEFLVTPSSCSPQRGLWFTAPHGAEWKGPDPLTQALVGGGPRLVLLPLFSSLSAAPFLLLSKERPLTIASLKKKMLQNTETIKDVIPTEGPGGNFLTCIFLTILAKLLSNICVKYSLPQVCVSWDLGVNNRIVTTRWPGTGQDISLH